MPLHPVITFFYGIIFLWLTSFQSAAQDAAFSQKYNANKTRILLILDASGSMNESWEGKKRFETSKSMLVNIVDSVERNNPDVEFGLRIFGHQSPKADKNCKDSKLEIPFAKNNSAKIKARLQSVEPQGWTPIAYSLLQAANDFEILPGVKNAIILITDGLENCEGDLCAVAQALEAKRITLKPFIIGIQVPDIGKKEFDCLGYYFDISTKNAYQQVLKKVVAQALNTTTAQINLLDEDQKSSITDLGISIYDHNNGTLLYNFIHTFNSKNQPDTLYLDPVGKYDIVVNSIPPVEKKNIELIPGQHNIININAPQGYLELLSSDKRSLSNAKCLVMQKGSNEILFAQRINNTQRFLSGNYHVEILTLPRIRKENIKLNKNTTHTITIPAPGYLVLFGDVNRKATVFLDNEKMNWVWEFESIDGKNQLELQPGSYKLLIEPLENGHTEDSKLIDFQIESKSENTLRL